MTIGIGTGMGPVATPQGVPLPNGGSVSALATPGFLTLLIHGRPDLASRIQLPLDDSVAPGSDASLSIVAEAANTLLVLQDTHTSRAGGLSYCQAGAEVFLRVLDLGPKTREAFGIKLISCLTSLDLDDPGLTWDPARRTIAIRWLTQASAIFHVAENGSVEKRNGPL